ncbi:hypothetical protein GCK72_002530 [Caenorhabditis remanei]|uniref:Telomerase reverse transcriptase n=1 Tax=Caenorhabditis remanei TaxID=31234 RepID=A0A6A5HS15_CAERE|nr:hypothetical protein GCK72_002530 [Caenorhabditis remanei]KAF1770708.1 hypothetical protein GCK72_002530 [Caenorhabditis remanei]
MSPEYRLLFKFQNKDVIPLAKLHKNLGEDHWSTILRGNANLAMLRNIFKRKMKGKLNYRHMSAFLVSSENVLKVRNTVVMDEVDKLSKSIMSTRHNFELRKLAPKRKLNNLKDCYMFEHETMNIIRRVFTIFRLRQHIGSTNCDTPLARAFRAKQVLKDVDPLSKRYIQFSIINHLRGALIWWIFAALRQIMIPIDVKMKKVYLWRGGYLKLLRREMKDFKERYKVKRVIRKPAFVLNPSPNSVVGRLKFDIVENKFRPIIRRNPIDKVKDKMHWKKVNSMLTWCLEKGGETRQSINASCKILLKFLRRNDTFPKLFGYTADVSKCFSAVKHSTLTSIIERHLLENLCDIWTACGKGRDKKGFHKLIFCSNDSEEGAYQSLKKKMESKHVEDHSVIYCNQTSRKWLLDQLRSTISSYCYKRGKTTFKITKGVPQGHPLSPNFAFMYLNDFEKENWRKVEHDARIIYCRYVDDYVFMMTDKDLFKNISQPLFTGKNQHGVKANYEKCKESDDKLIWCGVKMDLKNAKFYRRKRCLDGTIRDHLINFDKN